MSSPRAVQRIRHELKIRDVKVSQITQTGANMLKLTFSGDVLKDFVSLSFDDHIKFIFSDGAPEPHKRDYTPVDHDAQRGELSLEFALHAEGAATDWARAARIGSQAVIAGPRGSMIIPVDYDWHLLIGDLSALPAITRRLKELPAGTRAQVLVEISDPADMRQFDSAAELDVRWVRDPAELFAQVRALSLPAGEGYTWAAGEGNTMKQLRAILVEEKGIAKDNLRVAAYWKQGASDFHERLD